MMSKRLYRQLCCCVCFCLIGGDRSFGQINEDYVAGDASGWNALVGDLGQLDPLDPRRAIDGNIDVSTWQIGRIIDGSEPDPAPNPITGGAGDTVLTYDIRQSIDPGSNWDVFQKATRDFSFRQDQFDTHVVWLEFSSFSNWMAGSTETAKLDLTLEDDLRTGVRLGNNWNFQNAFGQFGTRANQIKPRRALLKTDGGGEVEIDPGTGLPVVRDVLDGNTPATQLVTRNLNYRTATVPLLFSDGLEQPDADGLPEDGVGDDDQPVLNTLYEQHAVVRLDDYRNFGFEVEWRSMNPDASGYNNWRSFASEGLGSGTTLSDPSNQDSLVITEPIGDITNLRLQATFRDAPEPTGFPGFQTPGVIRANENIVMNEMSTNGAPDNPDANQQIGLGKFVAQVYHAGDLNRDGAVTASDLTGSDLLGNLGALTVVDPSIVIGDPVRDVSWVDGDAVNDGRITVGDAMAGVLTGIAGVSPSGPSLLYSSGSGELRIDTGGAALSGFALLAADGESFFNGAFNNPAAGAAISTQQPSELSWMNLTDAGAAAGSNLTGTVNLGAVLPAGLSDEQLEAFFAAAVFNVSDALSKSASFFAEPGLPGDFNGDGSVDAADYTVWRDGLGTTFVQADYDLWANNFGATANSPSVSVPEPSALPIILAAGFAACGRVPRSTLLV